MTHTQGQKNKNQSTEMGSECSQMLDLADEDFKTATIQELDKNKFKELKEIDVMNRENKEKL